MKKGRKKRSARQLCAFILVLGVLGCFIMLKEEVKAPALSHFPEL